VAERRDHIGRLQIDADRGDSKYEEDASETAGPSDKAGLESFVGYNLRRAAARQRERFREIFAPYDIRPVQLSALAVILHNGGIRQSELGASLDMKRANVVKLLDELQDRGLLERKPSNQDRRAYEVSLTRKGSRLTRELLATHAKLEADLSRSLGKEQLKLLVHLLQEFRKVDSEPDLT
jgi:DNA-binding MarR family transcriptional regulator